MSYIDFINHIDFINDDVKRKRIRFIKIKRLSSISSILFSLLIIISSSLFFVDLLFSLLSSIDIIIMTFFVFFLFNLLFRFSRARL